MLILVPYPVEILTGSLSLMDEDCVVSGRNAPGPLPSPNPKVCLLGKSPNVLLEMFYLDSMIHSGHVHGYRLNTFIIQGH
jgi:hypothetical protein